MHNTGFKGRFNWCTRCLPPNLSQPSGNCTILTSCSTIYDRHILPTDCISILHTILRNKRPFKVWRSEGRSIGTESKKWGTSFLRNVGTTSSHGLSSQCTAICSNLAVRNLKNSHSLCNGPKRCCLWGGKWSFMYNLEQRHSSWWKVCSKRKETKLCTLALGTTSHSAAPVPNQSSFEKVSGV